MRAIKNTRITSQAAESRRRGRWQEKNAEFLQARQERQEVRQERQDRVPPCIETNFRYAEPPQPNRCLPRSSRQGGVVPRRSPGDLRGRGGVRGLRGVD